jgi:transcription initiation factor IIE alpha subunit
MAKISLHEMVIEGLTAEGWIALVEQENALDEMGYACGLCGRPTSAAEADDNGGYCEDCGQS